MCWFSWYELFYVNIDFWVQVSLSTFFLNLERILNYLHFNLYFFKILLTVYDFVLDLFLGLMSLFGGIKIVKDYASYFFVNHPKFVSFS